MIVSREDGSVDMRAKNIYSEMYTINENISFAKMELDIIVALSRTWVETKQQIGRNWPWPLPAEFTDAENAQYFGYFLSTIC